MAKSAPRAWTGTLALAAIAAAGPAQTTSQPPDDIVVTGSRATSREIEKAARAVTPPGNLYYEPLAQFQAPVCPGVVGVPDDFAAAMVARIRSVAQRAGIRLAKPGPCRANLLVIVLANGQAALQNMRRKGPWLFSPINSAQLQDLAADPVLKDLAADPGPVHVWVSTEMRSRYGDAMTGRGDDSNPSLLKTSGAGSRMVLQARQDIVASVVIVDSAAVRAMPAEQIADYAAMRGLVQTRPPGQPAAVGTILSLFDKGAVAPPEMTRFDRAYLRAVYGSVPNIAGITKVAQVAHEVKKAANEE